jgi:hypothetical protein
MKGDKENNKPKKKRKNKMTRSTENLPIYIKWNSKTK